MSEDRVRLARRIATAGDLLSVVRVLKAHAAAGVGPYARAVEALDAYAATLVDAFAAALRAAPGLATMAAAPPDAGPSALVAFGGDHGLVGPYNEAAAAAAQGALDAAPATIFVVGARLAERLGEAGIGARATFPAPDTAGGVPGLVATLVEALVAGRHAAIRVVYLRPAGLMHVEPAEDRLAPPDAAWLAALAARPWPTRQVPDLPAGAAPTFEALAREWLRVGLGRAAMAALAAEQASRLAAMVEADASVRRTLERLRQAHRQARQAAIADELGDLVAGVEALGGPAGGFSARMPGSEPRRGDPPWPHSPPAP